MIAYLYQIYAYLRTQEHLSRQHRQATGILLYPTVRKELAEWVSLPQHHIGILTVNLADDWPQIEQKLLSIIENPFQ